MQVIARGGSERWPPGCLLDDLTPDEQAGLLALGTLRHVPRGEVLMHEGEPGNHLVLLLNGCVKVVGRSGAGAPILLAVRVAGDVVGELSLIDGLPRAATVTTASLRTTVRSISHREFTAHLDAHPSVARAVHRAVALKLRQATRFRSELSGASVLVRLARVLTQLGARYGSDSPSGGLLLDVHLTQAELAHLVSASDAGVERAFLELRRRGLVQTGYRQLLLRDPDGLTRLVDGSARDAP